MTKSITTFFAALILGGSLLAAPPAALAATGDCGQPSSVGSSVKTSDALTILKAAVKQATVCDDKPCICDVNDTGTITTADALLVLRKAVQQPVTLTCDCPTPGGPACSSANFESRLGSDLDSGWTGVAHNSELPAGAAITVRTLRRCTDNNAVCKRNSDCGNQDCKSTCDCNEGGDTLCEISGPSHQKNCLTTLTDCTTNSDCPVGVACIWTFGPPLPLSSGGTPVCVLSVFDSEFTGTADSSTGEAVTSASLKSRVFLGIGLSQPCPRCGAPSPALRIGQQFTCEGGQFNGAACTVDGVSETFGGTSFDCPPDLQGNVSGAGLAIRFNEVTTGTTTKTAKLPCTNFAVLSNPLNPNNPGKCTDTKGACSSNADCRRCTGNSSIACTSNAQCAGNGSCAEAPDQPISCGYWCQCGFCDGNASLPCFENSDCTGAETCIVGPGLGNAPNAPQKQPNDCALDKNICGQFETEKCATTSVGKCSEQSYRNCTDDAVCISNNAGVCILEPRPCFESRITRTGVPSPLGNYCAFEDKTCSSNADCTGSEDFCVYDASRAKTVALFCVPATASSAVNSAGGITGPGAVRLNGLLSICRCGDGEKGCDEQCDDGNTTAGDGCNDVCETE